MIARDLIVDNELTEEDIKELIDDLIVELQEMTKVKYNQKVNAVRELLREMAEKYPNWLAIKGDGTTIDRDLYWEDLIDFFENTDHAQ